MKNRSIANELRVSYHKNQELSTENFKNVNSSKLMEKVFRIIWDTDEMEIRESFYAIFFNSKLDVFGYRKIVDGGIAPIYVVVRLIISSALLCNEIRICAAHNHHSGTLKPSLADRQITRKLIDAASTLDIQVIDHLILTDST